MAQYLLSMFQPDGPIPPPEVLKKVMQELGTINEEIKSAGGWVFSGGLHPSSTATVLRMTDGKVLATDGPFAEGKEHIGGFLDHRRSRSRCGDQDREQNPARHHTADGSASVQVRFRSLTSP